ncbi:nuclear transport factor 2 family protein [Fulvivirga lutimaris]|uniref:nuclear transport factor 2 family protein n=1 Tax=Fulvivirga lutimaris TaxID=1819566 RepID=UPI001625AF7A|nr:nuclear transport factor 2 family protein [Fulvivirga lutimaris]
MAWLLIIILIGCSGKRETEDLEKFADTFINVIKNERNIDSFAALYKDPVLYSDPVWGAVNENISLDTLRGWFAPVFDPKTGWDFEIDYKAFDIDENVFAIKGASIDLATGERRLITSWFKIENGKIAEQMDLTPWSLQSLKYSPRFEEALKDFDENN